MVRTRRLVLRLALRPAHRRWLLLALMGSALPLSGQDRTRMRAVIPAPLGRHGQLLTTGTGVGAPTLTNLNRLNGTALVGTTNPMSGASLGVNGRTVVSDNTADNLPDVWGLGGYAFRLGGTRSGVLMSNRVAGQPNWGFHVGAAGGFGFFNIWTNSAAAPAGGNAVRIREDGAMPLCIKVGPYTFPGVTTCPAAHPVATVVVNNATNNRIPVVSDPCDGSVTPYPNRPPCPPITMGNQAVNRSSTSHGNNGRIVCCRLN